MNHGWQCESTDGPKGGWGLLSFSLFLSLSLTINLPTYRSIYVSLYLSIYLSTYLSIYLPIYLSTYLSIYLSLFHLITHLSSYLSIYLSTYRSIYLSIYLSLSLFHLVTHLSSYLSIYLCLSLSLSVSVCLSACLSVCLFIYLSIGKLENETILRDVLRFWTWQHQKRSNSAGLPHFSKLTTSKTKQFCETSSFFELHNIQNQAILRDFFNFWIWQHQKQSNSARLDSKIESWVQRWRPRTNAFCDFSTPRVNIAKMHVVWMPFCCKEKCPMQTTLPIMQFALAKKNEQCKLHWAHCTLHCVA